jgi:flagellar export protein FliJ
MAFHFSLAALLRYRQALERQQELRLLEANQRVVAAQRRLEDADHLLAAIAAEDAGKLKSGVHAAELHFDLLCRFLAGARRKELEKQLLLCQKARTHRLEAFQQARRQRETVDALHRRQFELYHQQETRREQQWLDDMFLLRREFLRR